ncbi:MAG: hypothetical protein OEX83_01220 [Gammaproteobacteria bacterium]|nr:hypothetical protein [Gammaproteobacteria bacterium]
MIKNKSLVLHPLDCNEQPDAAALITALLELKFIESSIDETSQRYLVGDDFLQLIIFLGCSPSVELAPAQEGQLFCHVRFLQPENRPRLITSNNTSHPRCPVCRTETGKTTETLEQWQQDNRVLWICTDCDFSGKTEELNWRHSAGVASFFIEVNNIFPNEAVPSDQLMSVLQKTTNSEWRYFYFND